MQPDAHHPESPSPSPASVATAGAIGGFAGAAIKLVCEAIVPPRTADREAPPGVLAANIVRSLSGCELSSERKKLVALAMHWSFSVSTSVIYGIVASRDLRVTPAKGIVFGIVVWAGFHEIALPLLRATPPLRELPIGEQVNEFISHAIFGTTVEFVRATVLSFEIGRDPRR